MTKLALSPAEAAVAIGLGRSKLYELLKTGQITAKKSGARTIITVAELQRFVAALPTKHIVRDKFNAGGDA